VSVITSIISILIAIALPLGIEWLRRPSLRIERSDDLNRIDASPPWRIVHVKVINKPLGGLKGRFLLRNTASGCRVDMVFTSRSDRKQLLTNGRWSATPQPISHAVMPDSRVVSHFNPELVPQTLTFDVAPHDDGEVLAVAIKAEGDASAFAFTSESYAASNMRAPMFELPDEGYDVSVVVRAGGISARATFVLTHGGQHYTSLRLDPA
jgi:hypothetical protein